MTKRRNSNGYNKTLFHPGSTPLSNEKWELNKKRILKRAEEYEAKHELNTDDEKNNAERGVEISRTF